MTEVEELIAETVSDMMGIVERARRAEDERRTAALIADGMALRRALVVWELAEQLESMTDASELLGISQPAVSALCRKARLADDLENFEVVVVAAENPQYQPFEVGRIAVQRTAVWVGFAADLDEAAALIFSKTGRKVQLVETFDLFEKKRWRTQPAASF